MAEIATKRLRVDAIAIGERHRKLDPEKVATLAKSISENELRSPPTVRYRDQVTIDGEVIDRGYQLVAGWHRLEACRQLGWEHIDVIAIDGDDVSAEMWEIAENLHRVDLTKEERNQHIRRYVELLKKREADKPGQSVQVSVAKPVGGRGHKGIAQEVAEQTGLSAKTVKRALNPESQADKDRREALKREAAEREREAKEAREHAKAAVCDFLLDALKPKQWDTLIALIEEAGGSLRASDLREWQSPTSAAA